MKRETYFAIMGVVSVVFGLSFLLLPEISLRSYGLPTDPLNVMHSRFFGSTLVAFGLIYTLARNSQDPTATRSMLVAGLVGNVMGAVISTSVAGNLQNNLAWMSVAIYGTFAVAAACFLLAAKPQVQAGGVIG